MRLVNFFIFFSTLFFPTYAACQTKINLDSLKRVLKNEKTDTIALSNYLQKLKDLQNEDIVAKEVIANWIIQHCKSEEVEYLLIETLRTQGRNYLETSDYTKATELYNKALSIGNEDEYYEVKCDVLLGLGNVFYHTEQFDKEKEYNKKSLLLAQKHHYKKGIANAKLQFASDLVGDDTQTSKDTFNLVFKTMNECLSLWKDLKDTSRIIHTYNQMGQYYGDYNHFDSALYSMKNAAAYFASFNYKPIDYYYFILGKIYHQKAIANNNNRKDFEEAINNFKKCLPIAKQMNNKKREAWCYDWLANTYERIGNHEQAYIYLEKHSYLYGSIVAEDNFKEISKIEHKYEVEKKEKEIIVLNSANQQKSTLNKILIGSAAALLFIGFIGYRNFKSKQKISTQQQKIQQQKITELEKDKQLLAIDAMLKGQEEERSRIAKDLHDGLGGMLSGTKLSFINMKENLVLTPENATLFDKSLSMLDNTIADLRKVAHNLMPEALVKFGLQEAVRDFCNSIQSSSNLKIVYQPLGENRKLSNTAEVFTYRIIQELVNNAVKHANASQIIVQLTTNNNKVGIAVEDDGKGFDVNALANSKGAGMDNIKYRVQYFNGTIDTVTSTGNGTSVNIELEVQS
jgi:two-component system, NarL family, sensor kinase